MCPLQLNFYIFVEFAQSQSTEKWCLVLLPAEMCTSLRTWVRSLLSPACLPSTRREEYTLRQCLSRPPSPVMPRHICGPSHGATGELRFFSCWTCFMSLYASSVVRNLVIYLPQQSKVVFSFADIFFLTLSLPLLTTLFYYYLSHLSHRERWLNPLMGWSSSADPMAQVKVSILIYFLFSFQWKNCTKNVDLTSHIPNTSPNVHPDVYFLFLVC